MTGFGVNATMLLLLLNTSPLSVSVASTTKVRLNLFLSSHQKYLHLLLDYPSGIYRSNIIWKLNVVIGKKQEEREMMKC